MATQPVRNAQLLTFGEDFELDLQLRELRRGTRVLKLERIPMELLLLLVQKSGQLVTREEIVDAVWGKDVFLDTDNSINGAIRKIRTVLKDHPEQPRFVQTVTGKGYRFLAPVSAGEPAGAVLAPEPVPSVQPIRVPATHGRRWILLFAAGLFCVFGVAAAVIYFSRYKDRPAQHPVANSRLMMAVLPFENLTGDTAQDYFSDGLTEEMITQLGRIDPAHLGVIARTSVMHYKRSQQPLDQIAGALGVQYVLEGSVRREANHVRITAQLIQTRDQTHLWAREYDRELSHLLILQSEIAQEIADEIQLTLAENTRPANQRPSELSPESYDAYDLYLKGRFFLNKRTAEGFRQALQCFQQAVDKDPKYARAYAGVADSYAMMSSYYLGPHTQLMPKAKAAALRALELDEKLAEAHTSLALIAENYDWDWQTAEREYRRAIELNANYATAHHWFAEFLAFQGRFDEALAENERARVLDPLSVIIAADRGAILYFSRQYDRAIRQLRSVLDQDPRLIRGHFVFNAYVQVGRFDEAVKDVGSWQRDNPRWATGALAYIYGRSGQRGRALHELAVLQADRSHLKFDLPPMMATAYAGMGDKDATLGWLEKAYSEHSNVITSLKVDPVFEFLHGDPRFQDLLRRVHLTQN